jgi:hypothetical protein
MVATFQNRHTCSREGVSDAQVEEGGDRVRGRDDSGRFLRARGLRSAGLPAGSELESAAGLQARQLLAHWGVRGGGRPLTAAAALPFQARIERCDTIVPAELLSLVAGGLSVDYPRVLTVDTK